MIELATGVGAHRYAQLAYFRRGARSDLHRVVELADRGRMAASAFAHSRLATMAFAQDRRDEAVDHAAPLSLSRRGRTTAWRKSSRSTGLGACSALDRASAQAEAVNRLAWTTEDWGPHPELIRAAILRARGSESRAEEVLRTTLLQLHNTGLKRPAWAALYVLGRWSPPCNDVLAGLPSRRLEQFGRPLDLDVIVGSSDAEPTDERYDNLSLSAAIDRISDLTSVTSR